ncbi:MAG: glycosyltransferase family 4 protein [Candidatus Moranbacteria bacterium]|nr:glycosyltransferase family 4 protein [Candidatus Moranbacteria bacterium]
MKKILLATRPLVPPWDEASKNFAYFLGREVKNHSLTLLTTKEPLSKLPESVRQESIFSSGRFYLRTKYELFSYLRQARARFDITHYLFTPTKQNTNLIKWFAKPTRGKTLQTIATLRDDLYSPDELRSFFFADQLVVYTDTAKQKLEKLGFTNVTHIYPGIDLNKFHPQPKNLPLLKQLGFTEEHFIVSYVGEYARLGATDMIAKTFIDFFRKNPETNIRIVFPGRVKNTADAEKKANIEKQFAHANLLHYAYFPANTITDVVGFYNSSDLIIFPVADLKGKFDVPLVIIEAYACGKPVILSDLLEFREFANERICVTIPKDSGTKLIESVAYLKDNKAVCESLGREARAFVEQHLDLKNTAKQYEEIYTSLS